MKDKKRYCIFAAQYFPHLGGVERYTFNLSKKLIEDGNEIETLILGGTDVPENTESVKISKRAYVKKSDEPVFKKIMEKGTKIFVQYVPNDKPEPLEKYI